MMLDGTEVGLGALLVPVGSVREAAAEAEAEAMSVA